MSRHKNTTFSNGLSKSFPQVEGVVHFVLAAVGVEVDAVVAVAQVEGAVEVGDDERGIGCAQVKVLASVINWDDVVASDFQSSECCYHVEVGDRDFLEHGALGTAHGELHVVDKHLGLHGGDINLVGVVQLGGSTVVVVAHCAPNHGVAHDHAPRAAAGGYNILERVHSVLAVDVTFHVTDVIACVFFVGGLVHLHMHCVEADGVLIKLRALDVLEAERYLEGHVGVEFHATGAHAHFGLLVAVALDVESVVGSLDVVRLILLHVDDAVDQVFANDTFFCCLIFNRWLVVTASSERQGHCHKGK